MLINIKTIYKKLFVIFFNSFKVIIYKKIK